MNFWLLKSEPCEYSWDHFKQDKTTQWTGVRNFEARNNMKKIQLNDVCFFYHTGTEKKIVGLAKVTKTYYEDPIDPKFGIIDITILTDCQNTLSLQEMKTDKNLQNMTLLKRSRLSVVYLTHSEAQHIINLTNTSFSL